MEHCPTLDQLEAALADRLEESQVEMIETHLETCPICQRLLDDAVGKARTASHSLDEVTSVRRAQPIEDLDPEFRRRLEQQPPKQDFQFRDARPSIQPPLVLPQVSGYEILEKLGHGGMGVVYKAWHYGMKRLVALKMILAGAHCEAQILSRFQNEIKAVARLQHPNIVQIFEIGEKDGLPYCTLEYVPGGNLAQKLNGIPRPPLEAASLVATLAHAMHHAHGRGIVHRDLTPSNVMLTADGSPKITDFGLAKMLVDGDSRTKTGDIIGTPSYMSPEQASGRTHEVSAATDIYTLGTILYEMLTGRSPFRAATPIDTVRQVVSDDAIPPSRLQPRLSRDLETICLKCLEKEPHKRYSSALALAEDLDCWREGKTINARRSSVTERVVKWARRRPAIAALLFLLATVAVTGVGAVLWQLDRAESAERLATAKAASETGMRILAERANRAEVAERSRAVAAREQAEAALYTNRIALAAQMCSANNIQSAEPLLDRCPFDNRGWEWNFLKRICHGGERSIRDESGLICIACSDDGKQMAAAGWMGFVRVFQLNDGRELFSLKGHTREIQGLAFRHGRHQVASGSADQTIRIWDSDNGEVVSMWKAHAGEVRGVAFSPDGRVLASVGDDGLVNIWDSDTAIRQTSFDAESGRALAVAFNPNGETVAAAYHNNVAVVWNLTTGKREWTLQGHQSQVLCVAFLPDASQLITSSFDSTTRFWDLATGKELRSIATHRNGVQSIAVSDDGLSLATASWDRTIQIWNLTALNEAPVSLRGHAEAVLAVAFPPGGRSLISGSMDRTIKIWQLPASQGCKILRGHLSGVDMVRFSPDGKTLASASWDQVVKIWDATTGECLQTLTGHADAVNCLAYSADSRFLVSGGADHVCKLWDLADGRLLLNFTGNPEGVSGVAFSRDGSYVASASGKSILVWKTSDGSVRDTHQSPQGFNDVSFSPEGRYLAATSGDLEANYNITLFDMTGGGIRTLKGHTNAIRRGQFTPDGKRFISAGFDKKVIVWDVETGNPIQVLKGHNDWILDIAIHPEADRLATTSPDTTVKIWELSGSRETLTIEGKLEKPLSVDFSPDGNRVAIANQEGTVQIWDATPFKETDGIPSGRTLDEGPAGQAGIVFSPDSRTLAGSRENGRIQLWDAQTGWETIGLEGHRGIVSSLVFSPDGGSLASAGGEVNQPSELKIWDLEKGTCRAHHVSNRSGIKVLAFLPSDKAIATFAADEIDVFNESTGEPYRRLHTSVLKQIKTGAVSHNGRLIAAGDDRGAIQVWNMTDGRDRTLASPHKAAIVTAVFASDDLFLFTADRSGVVQLWDAQSWNALDQLKLPGSIRSLSMSPDDRTFACGNDMGIVESWNLSSKQLLQTRYGYSWERADHVQYSPNGKLLAAAAKQGSIKLWNSN